LQTFANTAHLAALYSFFFLKKKKKKKKTLLPQDSSLTAQASSKPTHC